MFIRGGRGCRFKPSYAIYQSPENDFMKEIYNHIKKSLESSTTLVSQYNHAYIILYCLIRKFKPFTRKPIKTSFVLFFINYYLILETNKVFSAFKGCFQCEQMP